MQREAQRRLREGGPEGGCQTTGDAGNVEAHLEALLANLEETTYSQVQWGEQPSVATNLLLANYDTIYASTFGLVEVGLTSGSSMVFTDTDSVLAYLPAMGRAFDGWVPSPFAHDHLVNGACVCPSLTIDCNGVRINPTSDAANCGSCGSPCGTNEVCSGGTCTCASPNALCGSQCNLRPCQCVDLQNDPDNCGSCGLPCASHVCSAGVCQ